jgi:GT2 family glycosyltransferase
MRASVIIPVYNGAATLENTLRSFLKQRGFSEGHCELVLCDDGSRDGSREIMKQYQSLHQVRILSQENLGQSAATNQAALAARGDILIFAAQDVAPQDDGFVLGHVQGHAAGGWDRVVTGYLRYPKELLTSDFMTFLQDSHQQFDYHNICDLGDLDPMKLYAPNFSVKRSWFVRVGGFDEAFPYGFQDTDLGIRFHKAGLKLTLAPHLTCFHHHPLSMEQYAPKKRKFGRQFWQLYFKHQEFFDQKSCPQGVLAETLHSCQAYLSNRALLHRILQEIYYCQDREVEPLHDLYEEFSAAIAPLPPLKNTVKPTAYWCKYLFYNAILSFFYNQGIAERAVKLGLWRENGLDLTPLF